MCVNCRRCIFFLIARGKGLGQEILTTCVNSAAQLGYKYCYLETFNTMHLAMKLYERNGFKKIPGVNGKYRPLCVRYVLRQRIVADLFSVLLLIVLS